MTPGDAKKKFEVKFDALKADFKREPTNSMTKENFQDTLDDHLYDTLNYAYELGYQAGFQDCTNKETNNSADLPKFEKFYEQSGRNLFTNSSNQLKRCYSKIYDQNKNITDTYDEVLKIDMRERLRYLGFRFCTAVVIAAVVLGTAYLAQRWGITLPLSGVRQISA